VNKLIGKQVSRKQADISDSEPDTFAASWKDRYEKNLNGVI